jgi:hypothetical protein
MNTEIVEAIEQQLTGADRVTQIWELFGKHKENIEAIPVILAAIARIENYLERMCVRVGQGGYPWRPYLGCYMNSKAGTAVRLTPRDHDWFVQNLRRECGFSWHMPAQSELRRIVSLKGRLRWNSTPSSSV